MTTIEVRDKLRQAGYLGEIEIVKETDIASDNSMAEWWTLELSRKDIPYQFEGPELSRCLLEALTDLQIQQLKDQQDNENKITHVDD